MTLPDSPVARQLTASGPGAVAVIEVRWPLNAPRDDAMEWCAEFAPSPPRRMPEVPIGRIVFGQWRGEDLLVVRTEERTWEIHCHGGAAAVQRIARDLAAAGVCWDPEIPGRIPVAGCPPASMTGNDPAADEVDSAVKALLPFCRTVTTAELVLAQQSNGLREIHQTLSRVTGLPEDAENIRVASALRSELRRWIPAARHLVQPWRVAVLGPPNAGKSSLVNALAGLDRSIVSELPGTTRDLIEVEILIDGWSFLLIDTAGIRHSPESDIEAEGIRRAWCAAESADVVLSVQSFDTWQGSGGADRTGAMPESPVGRALPRQIRLITKADLIPPAQRSSVAGIEFRLVSALTGEGLEELREAIRQAVLPELPAITTPLPLPGLFSQRSLSPPPSPAGPVLVDPDGPGARHDRSGEDGCTSPLPRC